jgi:hypothetical protein
VKQILKSVDKFMLGGLVQKKRLSARVRQLEWLLDRRFVVHYRRDDASLLSQLCDRYGSDKGTAGAKAHPYAWLPHTYADQYSRLFAHCRNGVTRVFECGLGTNNPGLASNMGERGRPGASLRAWRDYFPNALVYGADIDRDVLFQEERIATAYMDQTDAVAIAEYWRTIGVAEFDFMVDDGLHTFEAGRCLFEHSIAKLTPAGIYAIEDVTVPDLMSYMEYFAGSEFKVDLVTMYRCEAELGDNSLVLIRKQL